MRTAPKKSETVIVRVDDDLKDHSKMILQRAGLTHSKAIRIFLEYIANSDVVPDWMIKDKKVKPDPDK